MYRRCCYPRSVPIRYYRVELRAASHCSLSPESERRQLKFAFSSTVPRSSFLFLSGKINCISPRHLVPTDAGALSVIPTCPTQPTGWLKEGYQIVVQRRIVPRLNCVHMTVKRCPVHSLRFIHHPIAGLTSQSRNDLIRSSSPTGIQSHSLTMIAQLMTLTARKRVSSRREIQAGCPPVTLWTLYVPA